MHHPPKQLALLISLIGIGVAPCAGASVLAPELLSSSLTAPCVLPGLNCPDGGAPAWALAPLEPGPSLLMRGTIEPRAVHQALVAHHPKRPHGSPRTRSAGRVMAAHVGVHLHAAGAPQPARAQRSVRLPTVAAKAHPPRVVRARQALSMARMQAKPPVATAAVVEAAQSPLRVFDAEPVSPGPARLGEVRFERLSSLAGLPASDPQAPVAPESAASTRVLRDLETVRAGRIAAGEAFERVDPLPPPATESAKVLAMLQDLAAPPLATIAPLEDGPAKRLRKLAARAEKAEAQAAAAALAAGVVDLELPLEAAPAPRAASPFGDATVAVAPGSLDRVRGGFSGSDGLNISFGIDRAVYVNGALATTTTLNVVDLGQAVAGRAGVTTLDNGTMALIQNGAGNSVATGSLSPSNAATVIQNTLDGQKIQTITTINATANTLGIYRSLNLGQSLQGALINSLRR